MQYIKLDELKKRGAIYVEELNLTGGGNPLFIATADEQRYYEFLSDLVELNGMENSFGDFYYKRVQESGRSVLFRNSTVGAVRVMQEMFADAKQLQVEEEFVLVQLEDRVLRTLLSISYAELLFSSFYFTKLCCTVWSNYNGRFLIYTKNEETKQRCITIARKYEIEIER